MTTFHRNARAGMSVAMLVAAALYVSACGPKPEDYTWAPADEEVDLGESVRVAVRLEGPSGLVTLAPDAVAGARLDMGPDGMATMVATLRPVAPADGESLAWETDLPMGGRWGLKVTASIPGQPEPLTGDVVFTAVEE